MKYILFALLVLTAQPAGGAPSQGDPAGSAAGYRVGPGDLLSLSVLDAPLLGVTARVSNSGKIHVPYLGVIRVTDLTTSQVEANVAEMLRSRGLVNEPWVTVKIDEYRSQPVYILGEVMLPGQFVMTKEMYLTDLITLGGGFNDVATPVGYLYRRKANAGLLPPGEAPTDEAIAIDFRALNEGTNPELNVRMRGGDVLYVPQRQRDYFFVVGDVHGPGHYEKTDDMLLASRALSMAGGPTRTAKLSKGFLVRFAKDGSRQEFPVDFDAILRGRKPDFRIEANDIVFVPGSAAKILGYGLLGVIPSVVTGRAGQAVTR